MSIKDRLPEEINELLHRVELQRNELDAQNRRLRQYRDRYIDLYESAPVGYATFDQDGYVQEINLAGARLFGAERDSLIGFPLTEYLAKRDHEAFLDHVRQCLHEQREVTSELTLVARVGRPLTVQLQSIPAKSVEGEEDTICRTAIIDITERRQMEETIRHAEERLLLVLEAANIGWWQWDLTTGVLMADDRCKALFGLSPAAEAEPRGAVPACASRRPPTCPEGTRRGPHAQTSETTENRFRVIWPDGGVHWLLGKGRSIHDSAPQRVRLIGVAMDITERKRAEEAARKNEEWLAVFMLHLPGAAWIKDQEGRYIYANPEGERIFGKSLEQLCGRTDEELFPPNTARQFRENDRRVLAEGKKVETIEVLRQPDGVEHHSVVSKFALPGASRQPAYLAGVAFDMTAHKQAEEARSRLAAIVESSDDAIISKDLNGVIRSWNAGAKHMFGYWVEEVIGQPITLLLPPGQIQEEENILARLLSGQYVKHLETVRVTKDGRRIDVSVTVSPVKDEAGQTIGASMIVRDITDRKRAEEMLKAAKESAEHAKAAAEQANRAKDHFLAVLSHELRTPLTPVVMAGVSMLQDEIDPTFLRHIRETLAMIGRSIEMEARLIDDLLDVSRISQGKIELRKQTVDLCMVIQQAAEVCKPDIESHRLRFEVDIGPAAPYWIEADASRLQQVFWNLLRNAIKFTPHDGCVGIRCRPDQDHVFVEVNDSGIGIEQEGLTRVFNAFEQEERSITRQFGGLGLGLAISKALVGMHGGMIEAHSEGRNKGATLRIRLPLVGPVAQQEAQTPVIASPAVVRPLRVLLVEDHPITAKMLQNVLNANGHTVQWASDVATVLKLADRNECDLLISDLGLPDGNGHELIR